MTVGEQSTKERTYESKDLRNCKTSGRDILGVLNEKLVLAQRVGKELKAMVDPSITLLPALFLYANRSGNGIIPR